MNLKYKISTAVGDKLTAKLIMAKCELLKGQFILDEVTSLELNRCIVELMKENNVNVKCENFYYLNGKCVYKKKQPDGYYKLTENTTVFDFLGNKI